jgi:DNA-binding SARP family transcriptional activator/predicted ATPase
VIQGKLTFAWTEFVGRERERASLSRLLLRARLVTVVGLSGVGKTRLARQVVEDLLPKFGGQVWFIPCDGLDDAAAIHPIIHEASGLAATRGLEGPDIVSELADRRALLFLDSADCLIEKGLRDYLQLWLERAPEVTVLLTSESPIGVAGEHLFPVRPMCPAPTLPIEAIPERSVARVDNNAAAWLEADALRLFEARAQQRDCEWQLTPTNLPLVIELCREMDWLPLGIELAAGQLSPWTEAQLLDQLRSRGNRLDLAGPGGTPRHGSLRHAIEWSWSRLPAGERELATHLAELGGQLFEQTLEPITGDSEATSWAASLYRKGILQTAEQAGRLRYLLPPTIRQYILEQDPDCSDRLARAARYALELAQREGERLGTPGAAGATEVLRHESVLLTRCWAWAREKKREDLLQGFALSLWGPLVHGMELPGEAWDLVVAAEALSSPSGEDRHRLVWIAGAVAARLRPPAEAVTRLRDCLDSAVPAGVRALAQRELGQLQIQQGQTLVACDTLQHSITTLVELGREGEAAWARQAFAVAFERLGDRAGAHRLLEESRVQFAELELLPGQASTSLDLARLAADEGRWEIAEALAEEALSQYQTLGQQTGLGRAMLQLARCRARRGDTIAAERLYTDALRWLRAGGSAVSICQGLLQVATERNAGLGLLEPAKAYRECITMCREQGLRSLLAHALRGLAGLYASNGLAERALGVAQEAVDVARETTETPLIQSCLELLGHLQGSHGRQAGLVAPTMPAAARSLQIEAVTVRALETPSAQPGERVGLLPVPGRGAEGSFPAAETTTSGGAVPIRVRLLGGMALFVGEEEVPLLDWWAKAKKLFAYLVIHRGRPVSRDILLEEFWPGGDQQRAIHSLQTTLSFLRRSLRSLPTGQALADRLIVARDGNYVFDGSGRCESDLQLFDEHFEEAARLKTSGRLDEAAGRWAEADRLYVGDLLPEFPYEDWCASPRERLRSHYLELLLSLGTYHRQAQRPREALRTAERMFVIDSCDERAHRMAMRCHVQLGRPVDALRQFERCCHVLERELRVQPSKATRDLHELIRQRMDAEAVRPTAGSSQADGLSAGAS